jgi:serine/threonine protein kinase
MGGGASRNSLYDSSLSDVNKGRDPEENLKPNLETLNPKVEYENPDNTLVSLPVDPSDFKVPYIHRFPFQDYRFIKKIGGGKLKCVYKAVQIDDTSGSKYYAVKEVTPQTNHILDEDFHYELHLLSQLSHPNLLSLQRVYEPASLNAKLYVVTEYLTGGEFLPALINHGSYSFLDTLYYFQQIASALHYLHSRGIYYGNLVPENIVFENPLHSYHRLENRIKLVGFERLESLVPQYQKRPIGDKEWKDNTFYPPEVSPFGANNGQSKEKFVFASFHRSEKKNPMLLKQAMDVWLFGEVFYFLLSGHFPKDRLRNKVSPEFMFLFCFSLLILFVVVLLISSQQNDSIIGFNGTIWNELGSYSKSFFLKVLNMNPLYRLSFQEILLDPWFRFDFHSLPEDVTIEDIDLSGNIPVLQEVHQDRLQSITQKLGSRKMDFQKIGRYQDEQRLATLLSVKNNENNSG